LGIRTLRAAAWAAALSGIPSTLHALATGRDPLEAALAAGAVLLPNEQSRGRLLAAAVPVHLALSLAWTLALDRAGVRTARAGALAGLAIGALDLGIAARAFPRVRALPLGPQLADHAAFGAIAASLL
jgi:drug/metabolite transporter superfamily protein YnfA